MKPKISIAQSLFQFEDEHQTQVVFTWLQMSKVWSVIVQTKEDGCTILHRAVAVTETPPTEEMAQVYYDYVYQKGGEQ